MVSVQRWQWWLRHCAPKIVHYTRTDAEEHARLLRAQGYLYVHVYECAGLRDEPDHWHVSTKPAPRKGPGS